MPSQSIKFSPQLLHNRYIQGFNAVPLFIMLCARSGFTMKKTLGFGYTDFFYHFRDGYGEMAYRRDDLEQLWQRLRTCLEKDNRFIHNLKQQYDAVIGRNELFFAKLEHWQPSSLSEGELLSLLRRGLVAQTESVGIAHILEPLGLSLEKEFTKALFLAVPDTRMYRKLFAQLTGPITPSFLTQEESQLRAIGAASRAKQPALLKAHAHTFAWLYATYCGPRKLSTATFADRLRKLRKEKISAHIIKKSHHQPLNQHILALAELITFTTAWQDERKKNILRSITYLAKILHVIAARAGLSAPLLYQLAPHELMALRTIRGLSNKKNVLQERQRGVFFLLRESGETEWRGSAYRHVLPQYQTIRYQRRNTNDELHGSTANGGTVIGRAKICRSIKDLAKVQKGDILVTSMTRPEFMPALQRAAGIITDEGGITSHAAIIARELSIPCIIGTHDATHALKDGTLVELKAHHGVVRILEE